MRTTITIDEAIFSDLMRFTRAKTRTEAINRALGEWVRRKKIEKLKSLRGKLDYIQQLGTDVLLAPGVSCGVCNRCSAGDDMLCAGYGILGEWPRPE